MSILRWFQKYRNGQLRTPQQVYREAAQAANDDHEDTLFARFLNDVPDAQGWAAIDRLKAPKHFFTSELALAQHERADWQLVDPRVKLFAARMVEEMRKIGVPIFVHSAYRTKQEQDALVERGRSKAKWPRAPHSQGAAVDLVHSRYAWELTKGEWAMIGKLGKEVAQRIGVPIVWGGDFRTFYDPAHWELEDWRTRIVQDPETGPPIHKTPRAILREMTGQPVLSKR